MDRNEVIRRIIEADEKARTVPEKARAELAALDDELNTRREEMHRDYYDRAEKRIEKVRKTEAEYADAQIAKIDAELKREIERIEREAESQRDKWADELFRRAIAEPEGE